MSGLLGAVMGAARGTANKRLEDIDEREKFDYQTMLMDAQAMKEMALKRAGIEMENEYAQKERDRRSGILQSERNKSNGVGGPGGYDPKAYDNLDEEGKAEFDFRALESRGEIDPAKAVEFRLNRNDKLAKAEAANSLAALKLDLLQQATTGKLSLMEAQVKLHEARANLAAAGGNVKPSDAQVTRSDYIKAYSNDPTRVKNGALTATGLKELKRLSMSEPMDTVTETEDVLDDAGNKIGSKSRSKKVPSGGAPAASGSLQPGQKPSALYRTGR